jgi:phosphatidylglycerophosphatase A
MSSREPTWDDLRHPGMLLALGFGSGLVVRRGAGTAGTVVGVLLYLLLQPLPDAVQAVTIVLLLAGGVPICDLAAQRLGHGDHSAVVWDEIAAFPLVMIGLAAEPAWILAGFGVFRLFDILKPWPISVLERRLPGGWGVMADDVLAALLACAVLHVARLAIAGI